jgi:predicted dehydrogenase
MMLDGLLEENDMTTYRTGIVGLSGIGGGRPRGSLHPSLGDETPHSHAGAYATLPRARVVAVCDLIPERLEEFVRTWGDTWPEIRPYTDYREMLRREGLDVLSVCTPDHRHADVVVDACDAGVKGIFCEKPLATSLADADRMIAAVERHGVVMTVDYWTRWWPGSLKARELLRTGRIGRLKRIVVTACGQRAMMFRNGSYALDWLCFFAESDPIEVFGALDAAFDGYGPRYAGDGGRDPRTDPGASAYVRFANDVRAFYNASQDTVDYWEVMLMGERGWIRFHPTHVPLEIAVDDGGDLKRSYVPLGNYARTGLVAAAADLLNVLEQGGEVLSPPREARKSVEIMVAVLQSHHRGGVTIRLPLDQHEDVPA